MRRPRTEAEMMEVAMDIEIGTGGMIVTVIETEVRGIGAAVKIVTEETGLIETVGDRSMSVIENESTASILITFSGSAFTFSVTIEGSAKVHY
jgi:hypothetical protein